MKINSKKIKVVATLVALFVFSSIGVSNAASYKITFRNSGNYSCNNIKEYTIKLNDYFSKYGNVIKLITKDDVVDTEQPIENETPEIETPEVETPEIETPEIEEPVNDNDNTTDENVDQPSNNEQEPDLNGVSAIEREVVRLVNVERQKNGLSPLELDVELSNVARTKSKDMATNNYFSHTSPTYGSPFEMMKQFGINYSAAGENIAMGQSTAASVVNAWMNSEGHRANILNANFTKIGVGYYKGSNGSPYWTQMFIRP